MVKHILYSLQSENLEVTALKQGTIPISLSDIRGYLKLKNVVDPDLDTELNRFVLAAIRLLEKKIKKSIMFRDLEVKWLSFDTRKKLPFGPVTALDSVYRIADDGTETLLSANQYTELGWSEKWLLVPKTYSNIGPLPLAIKALYSAGFAKVDGTGLPEDIKQAVMEQVAIMWRFQDQVTNPDEINMVVEKSVIDKLRPYIEYDL